MATRIFLTIFSYICAITPLNNPKIFTNIYKYLQIFTSCICCSAIITCFKDYIQCYNFLLRFLIFCQTIEMYSFRKTIDVNIHVIHDSNKERLPKIIQNTELTLSISFSRCSFKFKHEIQPHNLTLVKNRFS